MVSYEALRDRIWPAPPPADLATPAAFAETHSRGQWRRAPHLEVIEEACLDTIENAGRLILSVSVRHGKALDVDTPIPTPTGWVRIGDLSEGDIVFDERGQQCRVTEAFEPYETSDVHTIRFCDGSSIVADGDHQWTTYSYRESQSLGMRRRNNNIPHRQWGSDWATREETPARRPKVRTTKDLIGDRHYIPTAGALDLPDVDLPVDPYLFGYWLGDGHSGNTYIASGEDDIPHVVAAVERAGLTASTDAPNTVQIGYVGKGGVNPLRRTLAAMGVLYDKHVPAAYLRAGNKQRLALLQGLMDSDGGVERSLRNTGRVSFTNQNKALADAVAELFVGLGAKVQRDDRPSMLYGVPTGATAYRVSSSPPFQPFQLARKAVLWSDDSKGSLIRRTRSIRSIEPAEPCTVRCIAVDSPSRLFLAGEQMVPTHNSEYASKWLPAWFLGTNPDKRVILAGHEADFAMSWGRQTRDILTEHGHRFGVAVSKGSAAASRWDLETPHRGAMLTVGVGGSPIGRGADLCVVDDPIKSYADAMSPLVRKRVKDWWTGTMVSRIEPGGAVILIMARWHEDDLAGFLLKEEPGEWRELRLPAVADSPDDPLGRRIGEALWPERFPADELERRRQSTSLSLGEAVWLAQYQQSPQTPTGGMFPETQWVTSMSGVDLLDPAIRWVRAWDLAATEDGGDFTAGVLVGALSDGRFVVADVVRGQWSARDVRDRIQRTAAADPAGTAIRLPQDPGQAGKDQAQQLVALLAGYDVKAEPVTGSKEIRATGWAAQQQAGNVVLLDRAWTGTFMAEHTGFPRGTHDDQVDAAADAFNALTGSMGASTIEYQNMALDGTR